MRRIKLISKLSILAVLFSSAFSLGIPINANAADSTPQTWTYNYTGSEQTFTAPRDGYYIFETWGAQGGSVGSYAGGKGGYIKSTLYLTSGQTVTITVGGSGEHNGYNGGGGKSGDPQYCYGGGATTAVTSGKVIIAGGGGGATAYNEGGAGGSTSSQGTSLQNGETGSSGGGAGGKGGAASTVILHQHTGSSSSGGGCYTIQVNRHEHVNGCKKHVCDSNCEYHEAGYEWVYGDNDDGEDTEGWHEKWHDAYWEHSSHKEYTCGGQPLNTFDHYDTSCGKTEGVTADECTQSKGGTNCSVGHADESKYPVDYQVGVQSGDGKCIVTKVPRATLNYNVPDGVTVTNNSVTYSDAIIKDSKFIYGELPFPEIDNVPFAGWTTDLSSIPESAWDDHTLNKYCKFAGWDFGNSDVTLYAVWDKHLTTVTLNDTYSLSSDGEYSKYILVEYLGKYVGLPTLSANGYDFLGWFTAETGGTKVTENTDVINADPHTLYAQWKAKDIKVTFDKNGGTLIGSSQKTVKMGGEYGTLPSAQKEGYTFRGWFTDKSGSTQIGSESLVTNYNNHTLYALYEKVGNLEFGYTGGSQYYTIPEDGYYKLEAYGAQGGNYGGHAGGQGGYTCAVKFFTAGTKIQIEVGGSGSVGGYNGGGKGGYTGGGGATDFRVSGSRIMIAGGGGGASLIGSGENGGAKATGSSPSYNGQGGIFGGGGGYTGGAVGYLIYHSHNSGCYGIPEDPHNNCGEGDRISTDEIDGWPPEQYYTYSCSCCGGTHHGTNPWHRCYGSKHRVLMCGKTTSTVDSYSPGRGGTSWIDDTFFYKFYQVGGRTGNGLARITSLYELVLDVNTPTTTTADVKATNTAQSAIAKDTLNRLTGYRTPIVNNTATKYVILAEKGHKLSYIEYISEMPQPTLKGWTFKGWYSQPNYKTSGTSKVHSGKNITINTVYDPANYGHTKLLGNKIYAHWDENVYYIKYVVNDTDKNIYNDECTSTAKFGNGVTPIGSQEYTKNTTEVSYTQKCLYDHDVQVLQNLFVKTGYFFDGWYSKTDRNDLTGNNVKASGTGKGTGTKYNECAILKPDANGEQFKAGKCNFNYITDAKQHETSVSIPKWYYSQSGVTNGSNTVILYATWEPMRYKLMYNGNGNWNEEVIPYTQKVTGSTGSNTDLIRYDQYFNLDNNLFTRKAPYTIKVNGYDVVLRNGYKMVGWGFGLNTFTYNNSPSWDLLIMNSKPNPNQGLKERDYVNKQTHVRNVLSTSSIQKMDKYLMDWNNSRTVANIANKDSLHDKSVQQNLFALWRRVADKDPSGDLPGPDGDIDPDPSGGGGGTGGGGGDDDDDDDQPGCDDGCQCGKTDPTDPSDDDETGCTCKDPDKDPTDDSPCKCGPDCDCGKPKPDPVENGDDDTDPTDEDNDTDFGLTVKFDLNGGVRKLADGSITNKIHYLKLETFNNYYCDFDIVGNQNKDLLGRIAVFDAYGSQSKSNSEGNYDPATGLNYTYLKTGGDGTQYRLIGWSLRKRASKPDISVIYDGVSNNLNVYDTAHNRKLRLYNDTTFYAVWEPMLKMDTRVYRKLGDIPFADGTSAPKSVTNVTAHGGVGRVGAVIKPGEAGKYIISTRGMNKLKVQVRFDTKINDMYNNMTKGCQFYDNLNPINADNVDTLLNANQKSALDRSFRYAKGTINEEFHIPQYLGTKDSYITSIGVTKYLMEIKASQPSFFYKYTKGTEEVARVRAILYLTDTSGTNGGDGDDGGGDDDGTLPTPPPGGGGGGTGGGDDVPNTLGEFKTRIK